MLRKQIKQGSRSRHREPHSFRARKRSSARPGVCATVWQLRLGMGSLRNWDARRTDGLPGTCLLRWSKIDLQWCLVSVWSDQYRHFNARFAQSPVGNGRRRRRVIRYANRFNGDFGGRINRVPPALHRVGAGPLARNPVVLHPQAAQRSLTA
jgi:hypothetical protein